MPTFKIHIVNDEHKHDRVFDCNDDQYILEAAEESDEAANEENPLGLPYSCRAGACSSCTGKLLKGKVDQEEQSFLEDDKLEEGFILTCVAYPRADCKIASHAEEDIF
uniref:ferredoxin n=1 Tax=Cutleria multifida TaxID=74475 RepID=UPI002E764490|nr:ferredoxin [Cutleria multifida]WAM62559.1 ferredoxin [Cutleria multifida]